MVTDVTEFRLPDDPRRVYLSPAVDLYDGDVAAFSCGTSPSKALVSGMLADAVAATGGGFMLHSDCGWHYRTPDWVAACEAAGVTRSMSRRGHSPDNAACEGFFGRLKVEFFHGRDWRGWTAEAFIGELSAYVRWYREGTRRSARAGGRCTIRSGAAGSGSVWPSRPVQGIVRIPDCLRNRLEMTFSLLVQGRARPFRIRRCLLRPGARCAGSLAHKGSRTYFRPHAHAECLRKHLEKTFRSYPARAAVSRRPIRAEARGGCSRGRGGAAGADGRAARRRHSAHIPSPSQNRKRNRCLRTGIRNTKPAWVQHPGRKTLLYVGQTEP